MSDSKREAEERMDEGLLVSGFGWREASCITNEAFSPSYAVAYRLETARKHREPEDAEAGR
jgi:hypothetical protein